MIKIYFKKTKVTLAILMLLPFFTFAQINLFQTTNNDITGGAQQCNSGTSSYQNDFARLYNLTSLGYSQFEVTKVSFSIWSFTLGTATTYPVTVKVYESTGGLDDSSLTLKGEATVNVNSAMVGTVVEVPLTTSAVVTSPEMLIVFSIPNGNATSTSFVPGCNSNGQTAPAYAKAPDCGATNFMSYNDIGGSNQHLILFPTGYPTDIDLGVDNLDKDKYYFSLSKPSTINAKLL